MTDDDVLAAVRDCLTTARDSLAGEQMTRPARDIIAWARRRRLRHGLAAAATTAVIGAVAAPALLPGNSGNGTSPATLAAWTVTAEPGGKLTVTIRELRDPAGLQRQLRADGVPATVRFTGQTPRPCLYYPLSPRQGFQLQAKIFPPTSNTSGHTAFTINTTGIPAHIGLWITVSPPRAQAAQDGLRSTDFAATWTLVYASGHCPSTKPTHNSSGGGVVGIFSGGGVGSSGGK
jgi:hypothetical protein